MHINRSYICTMTGCGRLVIFPFSVHQAVVQDVEGEPLYEELEGENIYMEIEENGDEGWSGCLRESVRDSEDEGVWMDGDAGFSWGDTRMEQWRWEEEQGIWEDVSEDGYEERGHEEDEDKDEEEEEEIWE